MSSTSNDRASTLRRRDLIGGAAAGAAKAVSNAPPYEELTILATIGTGTFGRVKLVQKLRSAHAKVHGRAPLAPTRGASS